MVYYPSTNNMSVSRCQERAAEEYEAVEMLRGRKPFAPNMIAWDKIMINHQHRSADYAAQARQRMGIET